jgi:hypothetical protein
MHLAGLILSANENSESSGDIRTVSRHCPIPVEALERMPRNNGPGKALLYLRVADESERRFLESGLAHLTRYALKH